MAMCLNTQNTTYQSRTLHSVDNTDVQFVYPFNINTDTYLRDNELALAQTTSRSQYNFYDDFGNLTSSGVGTGWHSPTNHQVQTTNTYTNDTSQWRLGLLTRTEVTRDGQTRVSAFEYDAVTSLLTKEIIEPDSTDDAIRLTTVYGYDGFGNRTQTTVCAGDPALCSETLPEARTNTMTYDAKGQFAISASNALGHTETREYNADFGTLKKLTGPNLLETQWSYDTLGRVLTETRADGTQTTTSRSWCNAPVACPTGAYSKVTSTASGSAPAHIYTDQFTREIRREKAGFDGTAIYVDTEYDDRGRVKRTSQPYFADAAPGEIYWATPVYDILDRQLEVSAPDESGVLQTTRVEYQGQEVHSYDALNRLRVERRDPLGRTAQVTDPDNQTLAYSYDGYGNLLKTTDPDANEITLSYDVRGRKITQDDPDMGVWTYAYNAFGELIEQTDAKGQVSKMLYDKLGRLTQRTDGQSSTDENHQHLALR